MSHKGFKTSWYSHFLGIRMQHGYSLYQQLDELLRKDQNIQRFVEIGTGGGALSVFLALHAVQRDTHLLTYDIQQRGHLYKTDKVFNRLGVEFVEADAFDHVDDIVAHVDNKPTLMFCDGGDKRKELVTFAPLLPTGSIVAVHDYGDEIESKDVEAFLTDNPAYSPIIEDLWLDKTKELYTCFLKRK